MSLLMCRGRGGGVSEDSLEVFFVGLVIERNYVWCLVTVAIFMRFDGTGAKKCEGGFKVIIWGGNTSHKRRQFLWGIGFSLNTAVLKIYFKLYWLL